MPSFVDNLTVEKTLTVFSRVALSSTTATTANGLLTLTVTSNLSQVLTGSATGFAVQLPDATTLVVGQEYEVSNQSTKQISLSDGSASLLAAFPALSSVRAILQSNSTAGGTWFVVGSSLKAILDDQVQVVTANATLVLGQRHTVVNSSSAVTISLFQAATALSTSGGVTRGKSYTISNWGTGVVTVTAFSGDTIVGSPTAVLKFQYSSITLLPSSLGWSIN